MSFTDFIVGCYGSVQILARVAYVTNVLRVGRPEAGRKGRRRSADWEEVPASKEAAGAPVNRRRFTGILARACWPNCTAHYNIQ
jgi:hypothetical protein